MYRSIILGLVLIGVAASPAILFAQGANDVAARRAALEAQLAEIEKQIASEQGNLEEKKRERTTLERDIAILDSQIKKAQLSIKARDLSIQKISGDIGTKVKVIGSLDAKLGREKQSLGQLIRKTNELDDYSTMELLMSKKTLSDMFEELDSYDAVQAALRDSFEQIALTRGYTEAEKSALEDKKEQEVSLKTLQELEKKKIEEQERERQKILKVTKGQEAEYQKLIKDKERSAAQIRAELFALRDSAAIPFGLALEYANFASSKTGVRPALILGVLKQETRLGEYLGTGNWQVDMHPTRDRPLYEAITRELGYDPNKMPVSRKAGLSAYGGAMGPAQFIPSTWACYGGFINSTTGGCSKPSGVSVASFGAGPWQYDASKDRLRALLGKSSAADPWSNKDAFMASALLLKDNGAAAGTFDAERRAAVRYFAGWGSGDNPTYIRGYGDPVMEHAAFFQKQIDILKDS